MSYITHLIVVASFLRLQVGANSPFGCYFSAKTVAKVEVRDEGERTNLFHQTLRAGDGRRRKRRGEAIHDDLFAKI